MGSMGNLMQAFSEVEAGKTSRMNTGPNKFSEAQSAYLEMLGESPQQVKEAQEKVITEKQVSQTSKITAALQVIKETVDNHEDAVEAFSKIVKIVDACK